MPVPKNRFKIIDRDVTIQVSNLYELKTNGVINFPVTDLEWDIQIQNEVIDGISDLFDGIIDDIIKGGGGSGGSGSGNNGGGGVVTLPDDKVQADMKFLAVGALTYDKGFYLPLMQYGLHDDFVTAVMNRIFGGEVASVRPLIKKYIPAWPQITTGTLIPQDNIRDLLATIDHVCTEYVPSLRIGAGEVADPYIRCLQAGYQLGFYGVHTVMRINQNYNKPVQRIVYDTMKKSAIGAGNMSILFDLCVACIFDFAPFSHTRFLKDVAKVWKWSAVTQQERKQATILWTGLFKAFDVNWQKHIDFNQASTDFKEMIGITITPEEMAVKTSSAPSQGSSEEGVYVISPFDGWWADNILKQITDNLKLTPD